MMNEVINMISVVDVCYIALFAIGMSLLVELVAGGGQSEEGR